MMEYFTKAIDHLKSEASDSEVRKTIGIALVTQKKRWKEVKEERGRGEEKGGRGGGRGGEGGNGRRARNKK